MISRLLASDYSLANFEGGLSGIERSGPGEQRWPGVAVLSSEFVGGMPSGTSVLKMEGLGVWVEGRVLEGRLAEGKLVSPGFNFRYEGKFSDDVLPVSGIFFFERDVNVHFVSEGGELKKILAFKGETPIALGSQNEVTIPLEGVLKSRVVVRKKEGRISFERTTDRLLFGFEIDLKGRTLSYNERNNLDYADSEPRTEFRTLKIDASPFLEIRDISGGVDSTRSIFSSGLSSSRDNRNGTILHRVNESDVSLLCDKEGKATLFTGGEKISGGTLEGEKLVFENWPDLLTGLARRGRAAEPPNREKMNGFSSLTLPSGLTYSGFFLNDTVHCHKDLFMTCLSGFRQNSALDEFASRVKKIEGVIIDGKIEGRAKVQYLNGEHYHGTFNKLFQRHGKGQLLQKDKLFIGGFAYDRLHGIVRVLDSQNEFFLGQFEEGQLKRKFEIDELSPNDIAELEASIPKAQGVLPSVLTPSLPNGSSGNSSTSQEKSLFDAIISKQMEAQLQAEMQTQLDSLTKQTQFKTIYSFRNGYSYYGTFVGDKIMENEMGELICPDSTKYKVRFKMTQDFGVGCFRSVDGQHVFLFKPEDRIISHVELDSMT